MASTLKFIEDALRYLWSRPLALLPERGLAVHDRDGIERRQARPVVSIDEVVTRRNQNRRPCLVAILRCPVVVVGKGFRASTVWASKRGKIGHPTLALKTDEHEW